VARNADFIVVGAGIAGLSVAYELSQHGSVVVLEAESAAGYHATGRSAAVISENYGPAIWSRLVTASRRFLDTPPDGFSELPLLSPRGALFLALEHERDALRTQADGLARRGASFEVMTAGEALKLCPVIRAEKFAQALYEPDCMDIDTNALMNGYGRALRRRGGQLLVNSRVERLAREAAGWRVWTDRAEFRGAVVVNAAGGWVQQVARMAGLGYRNVVPFRRTAVTFDPPAASDIRNWPMTFDVAETFYFKPEASRIMVSPVDMAPSDPCDAQADELETAIAIDRIHTFTRMAVRTISRKWGGLRTFAPDHEPVIGPDPEAESFIWLAGQGGNGVMGCAAAARLAASLAIGAPMPSDIASLGITAESVSPGRPCVAVEVTPAIVGDRERFDGNSPDRVS
jgi:D-arginine dehydrogenase